jgi:hypothetical protein
MALGSGLNRFAFRLLAGVAALAALAPAAAAAAPQGKKGGSALSPDLEVLARPAVAADSPAEQADRIGAPARGPGSLVRDGERVLVTARFARGAIAAFEQLRDAGARVVDADAPTQTLTLAVSPEDLPALAAVPGLEGAWQVREPVVYGTGSCDGGSAISEDLAQLRVDDAREAFELRGEGLTVGVLSDSFDTARQDSEPPATNADGDEASNDLPGPGGTCSGQQLPVAVVEDLDEPGGDEGRAMLQIVHDLAPHASLAFATAFESEAGFAQNIERLAQPVSAGGAGAEVIVDDVAWFEEPFFQEGPVAVAIDNVTAAGATYLSATGNDNLFEQGTGRKISSWEAEAFRDAGPCPAPVATVAEFQGIHCMDFNPGAAVDNTFSITVAAKQTLTLNLQWAEPWYGVATDFDAFLLSGSTIVDKSFEDNIGDTQRPVEIIQWENESASSKTVQLAINRYEGGSPRLKFILLQNGGGVTAIEYSQSSGGDVVGPSIYGHAGSPSAISVAAVPFSNSGAVESYSSRGPVTHYFGPVVGTAAAAPLGSPEVISKPDLAATDCGATTFFASLQGSTWRFCGTSAAAPHAAAVAALVRQAKPTLPAQQVRSTLTDTAVPVGSFGAKAAGAGLIDAFAAIAVLPGPIEGGDGPGEEVSPTAPPTPEAPTTGGVVQVPIPPAGPMPPAEPAPPSVPAPDTVILRRPAKLVRTRAAASRLIFRFGSDQSNVAFLCQIDGSLYRPCSSRLVRRFGRGAHVLRVRARSATGHVDPTPAAVRFRIVPEA